MDRDVRRSNLVDRDVRRSNLVDRDELELEVQEEGGLLQTACQNASSDYL